MYRVDEADYGIHILVVAPHEYVNTDSTRRLQILERGHGHTVRGHMKIPGGEGRDISLRGLCVLKILYRSGGGRDIP